MPQWREMMSCIAVMKFHIKLYIPWALFSVYVHSGKRSKIIVFLFTILKGSCDFIKCKKKNRDKYKGTVSSPQVFSGIFSTYILVMLSGSYFSNIWTVSALKTPAAPCQYPPSRSTQPTPTALSGHLQERPVGVAKHRWVQPPLFTAQ